MHGPLLFLSPLQVFPWFVPDSSGTYAPLMVILNTREMGKSLPSSSCFVWGLQNPRNDCGG